MGTAHYDPSDPGRNETPEERDDRNLTELLQELRVAGLGIQVLFGFLLSLPFTNRFHDLDSIQRGLYLVAIFSAVASIVMLTAPVAYHRLVFRRHRKERLVRFANLTAIIGLACVAVAVSAAVVMAVSFVGGGTLAIIASAAISSAFAGLWFVVPVAARRRARRA